MTRLLIPEPQPQFPFEDVNSTNSQVFSQLLAEPEYIHAAHDLAEQQVYAFKQGHRVLRSLGYVLYADPQQQHAFSYGATIYEALSTTVRPIQQRFEDTRDLQKKLTSILSHREQQGTFVLSMMDEEERLAEEAPKTKELIDAAANYEPTLDRRLIVWGAALERSIDIDTIDAPMA